MNYKRWRDDEGSIMPVFVFSAFIAILSMAILAVASSTMNTESRTRAATLGDQAKNVAESESLYDITNLPHDESFDIASDSERNKEVSLGAEGTAKYSWDRVGPADDMGSAILYRGTRGSFDDIGIAGSDALTLEKCNYDPNDTNSAQEDLGRFIAVPSFWKQFRVSYSGQASTGRIINFKNQNTTGYGALDSVQFKSPERRGCYMITGIPGQLTFVRDSDDDWNAEDDFYGVIRVGTLGMKGFALFGSGGVNVQGQTAINGHVGSNGDIVLEDNGVANSPGPVTVVDGYAQYLFENAAREGVKTDCEGDEFSCRDVIRTRRSIELDEIAPATVAGTENRFRFDPAVAEPNQENRVCYVDGAGGDGERVPTEQDLIVPAGETLRIPNSEPQYNADLSVNTKHAPANPMGKYCFRNIRIDGTLIVDSPADNAPVVFSRGDLEITSDGEIQANDDAIPSFVVLGNGGASSDDNPSVVWEPRAAGTSEAFIYAPYSQCRIDGMNTELVGGMACTYINVQANNMKFTTPTEAQKMSVLDRIKDVTDAGMEEYYGMTWYRHYGERAGD